VDSELGSVWEKAESFPAPAKLKSHKLERAKRTGTQAEWS